MSAQRPGLLTTIAIIGIVLGSLGALSSLGSLAALAFQDQIASLQSTMPISEAQREFTEQIREVSSAFNVPSGIGLVANLITCILLIVGGAQLLGRRQAALGLMIYTVIASIVVDFYNLGLAAVMQARMMPLMEQMTRDISGANAELESVVSLAQGVGLAMSAVWLLFKLAYYIAAIVALRRSSTSVWFAAEAAP